jgi:hypothetical protein
VKLALVPNDDGYGPSALGYYVAEALLRRGHSLVVVNESAQTLNATFYKDEISQGNVSLQPTFGGIRMRTIAEGVDTHATLRDIQDYPRRSDEYTIPNDVDALIDIGTPAAVRAAHASNKPVFTVFDHAWGMTYEKTLDNLIDSFTSTLGVSCQKELDDVRTRILQSAAMGNSLVVKAIERIKEDERKTSAVFLFDDYITPDSFCKHWEALGVKIVPIEGVFGGKRLASREEARKRMGISESPNDKTVYILGGGTPVWDAKLPEVISQLKEKVLNYNVVVFDRNAKPDDYQRVGNSLYKGGAVYGETVQGLLPGVDLIITRAGGGIANDAIACRVPFVCVEEPGHWQVEMIRKNCERRRLTRTIPIDQFRRGDIAKLISDQLIRHEANNTQQASNREIREKMKGIDNGKEDAVAGQIVEWCRSTQEDGRSG